jgi:hypothetical protein
MVVTLTNMDEEKGRAMATKWTDKKTFHLGINMAGAVSAGAYTAGVLDFLMEALEQWYLAKSTPGAAVPMHDVSIGDGAGTVRPHSRRSEGTDA